MAMLAQEPGNARALVILGELKRDNGDDETAAALMRRVRSRSLHEPVPQAWLIDDAIEKRDWPLAMRHADILMRMHARTIPYLTPLLARSGRDARDCVPREGRIAGVATLAESVFLRTP